MKKRRIESKRQYIMLSGIIVFILLIIVGIGVSRTKSAEQGYSENYVAISELPSQMSFTYYDQQGWKNVIKEINNGKNLKGKLTYGKMEDLLKKLSIGKYVTYEKKSKSRTVSRKESKKVYEQILDLLEKDSKHQTCNLLIWLLENKQTQTFLLFI